MEIIRIPRIMRDTCGTLALRGRKVGLVPTMGALHEGHASLIRMSQSENHHTVVSVFVNPTQFGQGEDYDRYPRDPEEDVKKLGALQVDYAFVPDAEHMYPKGYCTTVQMGRIAERLCGAFRPGHFSGVATVVAKLLNIVRPLRAYFGQKDYQQFLVVKQLAQDLNIPVEIVMCPTIREEDGLALSSRNAYLSPEERWAAPVLYRALKEAADMMETGYPTLEEVLESIGKTLESETLVSEVQYAGAYDPATLEELAELAPNTLLAGAVKVGNTRLIDNILVQGFASEKK